VTPAVTLPPPSKKLVPSTSKNKGKAKASVVNRQNKGKGPYFQSPAAKSALYIRLKAGSNIGPPPDSPESLPESLLTAAIITRSPEPEPEEVPSGGQIQFFTW
jgi:hypothetical protein